MVGPSSDAAASKPNCILVHVRKEEKRERGTEMERVEERRTSETESDRLRERDRTRTEDEERESRGPVDLLGMKIQVYV